MPEASDIGGRQRQQRRPDRPAPCLELCQERHAERDHRDDEDGDDGVREPERNAERAAQALAHDRTFKGEIDKGEGGVDQRGDRRAEIAKPRAARQQIHVEIIFGDVAGDGDAGDHAENHGDQIADQRIGAARGVGEHGADGEGKQGRGGAEPGRGDDGRRPAAERGGGVAQRIIFHLLVLDQARIPVFRFGGCHATF